MNKINSKLEIEKILYFLSDTIKSSGKKGYIIGVSGGIDSSVVLGLATRAVGVENVFCMTLPYGDLNPQGLILAKKYMEFLNLRLENHVSVNIKSMTDIFIDYLNIDKDSKTRIGNIMARIRMILLFDFAKKNDLMVCGTENKSEHLLGYYTRYGDGASDLEPIIHLYKTQVYELAKELNILEEIILQAPTAGLWENQSDENEFGFSYAKADEILSLYYDSNEKLDAIIKLGYTDAEKVISLSSKNEFKKHVPYVVDR